MAGLLMKELIARGDLERCLVVCPGSLAEQWQDELYRRITTGAKSGAGPSPCRSNMVGGTSNGAGHLSMESPLGAIHESASRAEDASQVQDV